MKPTPDPHPIRAFLSDRHASLAGRVASFAASELAPVPEPTSDDAAREEARHILKILGTGGWLDTIRDRDWRGCCLVREALGAASPLADAVFALQGLSTVPILMAGGDKLKERWARAAVEG
ncbi:MAG TPA: acyl-CoA dehydrogenase family protein, partial [Candidatus Eisenbacteria bacterium]|nr:acyl-CoA dehydrogenase family protein [Candidatus Eisenbacteria bacterium]